ncbi:SDR family NAD(P)-dependent oxidoreductase [Trebonia sp.]|uniref:SDR family NAD(P)-dependent oxidoreductase n=1 Tax=Trebonia sp. TaxID=2767075 RepID=UPI002623D54A|nr:SDR family NAD(P)-dependent oxidoreductase [Trebonia sp.]
MSDTGQRVAIITGGSQGIGAGLVAGYRGQGWAALDRFGRIDTLVNDAGVFISKRFTDFTADDYALVVGVNLTGFFWLTQHVIAEMLKRGGGHVVNISATVAEYALSSELSVLAALTKGGVASATRALFLESAPYIIGEILHVDGGRSAGH